MVAGTEKTVTISRILAFSDLAIDIGKQVTVEFRSLPSAGNIASTIDVE